MIVSLAAICAISAIEIVALMRGINGKALAVAGAMIGAVAGANLQDLVALVD